MAAVSVDQCTVHLYPMAADIKRHQQLEYNGVLRVELTENHEQTCRGASIGKEEVLMFKEGSNITYISEC